MIYARDVCDFLWLDSGMYLTLDAESHRVVGKTQPSFKFVIRSGNVNEVSYLKDDGNRSWIYVGPAPASGHAKYWIFMIPPVVNSVPGDSGELCVSET